MSSRCVRLLFGGRGRRGEAEQLHFKHERGIGRDSRRNAVRSVRIGRAQNQTRLLTHRQSGDAFVPTYTQRKTPEDIELAGYGDGGLSAEGEGPADGAGSLPPQPPAYVRGALYL
jgi:hypothetical protein